MYDRVRLICAAAALALVAAPSLSAQALFVGSLTKKVKNTATKAVEKTKKAADTVVDTVKGAGKQASEGVKKAFQRSKAAVVKVANKAKVAFSKFISLFKLKGNAVLYEYLPGKLARLHKNLMRPRSKGPRAQMGEGGSGSGEGATDDPGLRSVPSGVEKFADWYNYKDGETRPSKSKSRKDKQSLVADQTGRGTCVAHAITAAIEALHDKKLLSKEYAWWLLSDKDMKVACENNDVGYPLSKAVGKKVLAGLPMEVLHLYTPFIFPKELDVLNFCAPAAPSKLAREKASHKPASVYAYPWHESGSGATISNPRFVEAVIDAGYDIVGAFDIALMKQDSDEKKVHDPVLDKDTGLPVAAPGGHAMLIVGYERTGDESHGGGHVIIKNSWTALWADGGYGKLSYDYLRLYAGDALIFAK